MGPLAGRRLPAKETAEASAHPGTYLSKKVARRRRSRTLCFTPAHRWQFISWPRVMYTPEPAAARCKIPRETLGCTPKTPAMTFPGGC